ncbi:MAG: hypothetical protein J6C92_13800 [Bacteroidaceae bacterium]|nr:hypothetical protein [Bacteroidaceae bacterium]
MRNAAFCLLSETEKNSKFRAILNDKTDRTLTAEEMRSIILCVSPRKQCSIVVHNDADKFREVLQLSSGFRGKTVLGQVLVSHDNTRGELYCPALPAAILLNNQADESSASQLHIYIPPSRLRKGNQKV